jgi:hypothetical protein
MSIAHCYSEKDRLMLVLERFTLIITDAINRFRQEEEKGFSHSRVVMSTLSNKPITKE